MHKDDDFIDEKQSQKNKLSPFSIFCQLNHSKFKSLYPRCTSPQIENLMAQEWDKMSQRKRQTYFESASHANGAESAKVSKRKVKQATTTNKQKPKQKRSGQAKETDEFVPPPSNSRGERIQRQYPAPILDDNEQNDQTHDEEETKDLVKELESILLLTSKASSFDDEWDVGLPVPLKIFQHD